MKNKSSIRLFLLSVTKKLTQFFYHDVLDNDRNRLLENLVVGSNGGQIKSKEFFNLKLRFSFSWSNSVHHRISMGFGEISGQTTVEKSCGNYFKSLLNFQRKTSIDSFFKATTHIENELKLRTQSYNSVKQNLESLEKKQRFESDFFFCREEQFELFQWFTTVQK